MPGAIKQASKSEHVIPCHFGSSELSELQRFLSPYPEATNVILIARSRPTRLLTIGLAILTRPETTMTTTTTTTTTTKEFTSIDSLCAWKQLLLNVWRKCLRHEQGGLLENSWRVILRGKLMRFKIDKGIDSYTSDYTRLCYDYSRYTVAPLSYSLAFSLFSSPMLFYPAITLLCFDIPKLRSTMLSMRYTIF